MWMSLIPCSRRAARIGQVWPPLTANRYLTPCDWRTRAARAPPSTLAATQGADFVTPSPASAAPAALPITTPENPSLELPEFVIALFAPRSVRADWRTCREEPGAAPFRWRSSAFRLQQ